MSESDAGRGVVLSAVVTAGEDSENSVIRSVSIALIDHFVSSYHMTESIAVQKLLCGQRSEEITGRTGLIGDEFDSFLSDQSFCEL